MYSKNHYCYYCYYIKPYTMCRSKSMAQQYGGERALLNKEMNTTALNCIGKFAVL